MTVSSELFFVSGFLIAVLLAVEFCDARSRISINTHYRVRPVNRGQHFLRYRRPPRSLEEDEFRRPNISLDLDYLENYENGNEIPSNPKELYTHQPVVLDQEDPQFAEPIASVTVAANRTAELKCIIDNLGNYTVAWLNVDKQTVLAVHTHVIAKQDRVRVSHNAHREFSFLIDKVRPEDSGYYMCQINTLPMKNQVGFLNVVVAPYFLEQDYNLTVRENDDAILRCHAGGNPQPKITWRREDSQAFNLDRHQRITTHSGPELHIRGVSRRDMGIYICLASNGVPTSLSRRIHLEVIFPPLIRVLHQLVYAALGDNVILECHVEASPVAEPIWLHRSQRLGSDHKYHTSNSQEDLRTMMRLRVRITHRSDFGMYRCTAQNKIGHTEAKITLHERRPTSMPTTTTAKPTKPPRKPSRKPPQSWSPPTTPLMYWVTTKAPVLVSIFDINKGNISSLWNRNNVRESSKMASSALIGLSPGMHLLVAESLIVSFIIERYKL